MAKQKTLCSYKISFKKIFQKRENLENIKLSSRL